MTFSISGREVQGKDGEPLYFTSLDAWKIEPLKDAPMGQDLSSPFDTSDDVPF